MADHYQNDPFVSDSEIEKQIDGLSPRARADMLALIGALVAHKAKLDAGQHRDVLMALIAAHRLLVVENIVVDLLKGIAEGYDPRVGLRVLADTVASKRQGVLQRVSIMMEMCRDHERTAGRH